MHAEVVPVDVQRPLLRELLAPVGVFDLPLQIRRVRALLFIRRDAALDVRIVNVNVAQAVEPLRPRSLFVVLVQHRAGRTRVAAVRRARVIVTHRASASLLFQRGFPLALLERLLLVVFRLALASEHFTRRHAALARGAPIVLGRGRALRGVRGGYVAPGRTNAAGGGTGRAVEPTGRGARGEESLALLQVHRERAFRGRGTSGTSPSCGTERERYGARARSRMPESLRGASAVTFAYPRRSRRRARSATRSGC